MKRTRAAAAIAAIATVLSAPALAADVGVSISIGEPGFFGRIDIGGYPPPTLVYRSPVVIVPAGIAAPPVYLRVPPGHIKHWAHYCAGYGACAYPVYFVRDDWYVNVYAPRYRARHVGHARNDWGGPPHWAGKRGHGRGHGHDRD